jgi:subtilisin family serine protease
MKLELPLLLILSATLVACAHLEAPRDSDANGILVRQILVTARQAPTIAFGLTGDPAMVYQRRRGYGPAPGVERLLDSIADDYGLTRIEGWLISSLGVYCEVYELRPGQDRDDVLARVSADPRIDSAQPMNVYQTQGIFYDDPYASMQPALIEMSIDSAHESATGLGVTIGIIDSMVDDRHPEFRGRVPIRRNLAREHGFSGRAEIHGTAIAGIIASTANNAEGIVGIAPDSEIVSLRACWTVQKSTGRALCSSFSLAQSFETALRLGVKIINLSLSGPHDPLLERLVDTAVKNGVIVIAALPERDDSAGRFPAIHPGVIAVSSSGIQFPEHPNVLIAPGSEVLSTTPGSSYGFFTGNSMSAAYVSGVAALLVERQPEIDGPRVFSLLADTSTEGSVNACRAIQQLSEKGICPDVTEALVAFRAERSRLRH